MRTFRSFSEIYGPVQNASPNFGRIINVDLSDQSDIPAQTEAPQEDSLYSLCSSAAGLLGMMSAAVSSLAEDYAYKYQNMSEWDKEQRFVPFKDGSKTEFDLSRVGAADVHPSKGAELDNFSIDFMDHFDSFRGGMVHAGTDQRIYTELVGKIQQIREKLISEYKHIQELCDLGVLGNTDATRRKRVVQYMRPLNAAQKILLGSDLAQPFFFGKNAFTPVNPRDYVDEKLTTKTDINALREGLRNALAESKNKDRIYLSKMKNSR